MDSFEAYRAPLSDPEAEGLPEVADPDSHAEEELDDVRAADGRDPAAIPPDREDGPMALDEYGVSTGERGTLEPLARKLRRERPARRRHARRTGRAARRRGRRAAERGGGRPTPRLASLHV